MPMKNNLLAETRIILTPRNISQLKDSKKNYASLVLERLARKNLIKKVKKGKYTSSSNIFLIATNIIYPSYISFWSGIAYKGCTEQILSTIFVACTKKTRNISFENYKIKFIKLSKTNFFGYKKETAENGEIFVADNEKLLIDCLLYPRYSGNIDEVVKLIQNVEINAEKLEKYLLKIKNKSLIKKVGYLLEEYKKINIKIKIKDRNYVFLPIKKQEKINKKWRIKFNDN